ncbi:MAG: adenylate/guanylate cyclase domain-containing protein [Pseudomonadota bacterium]
MSFWQSRSPRTLSVLAGLLSMVLLFAVASAGAPAFDRLSQLVFDQYQKAKPRAPGGAPVLIVDIDEASINKIGQWPWPRSQLAQMVDHLGELGAAVIAFDMTFAEPDRTSLHKTLADLRAAGAEIAFPNGTPELNNDAIFEQTLLRNPTVAGFAFDDNLASDVPEPKSGYAYGGADARDILSSKTGALTNLPAFDAAAAGIGFFSLPPEVDGIIRRVPLIESADGGVHLTLGLETLRIGQGASNVVVRSTGASGEIDSGIPAIVDVRVGDAIVPTDANGNLLLYYSGRTTDKLVAAHELLIEPIDFDGLAERVGGQIVLIGTSALGLRDLRATPLQASTPGVTIHAELIDQIWSQTFLKRPDYMKGLEYVVAVAVTILLIVMVRPGQPFVNAVLALALLAFLVAVSWYFFDTRQVLVDPLIPALATILVFMSVTIAQYLSSEREKRFIRGAFGRYLAPAMVSRLSEDPSGLKLGGEMRELTLLFCDIRGFTSISEELDPEGLTQLLNDFLTPMTDELLKSGATIDKYMGDAIMAFWNAPLSVANHRQEAVKAALAMMRRLQVLNREKGFEIRIGIGLNTGPCCVGNLGSSQRFNYSAIGDAVNVAARIEGVTKAYSLPVLLAGSVLEDGVQSLEDAGVILLEVDRVRVVGRAEPLVLHTAIERPDLGGTSETALLDAHSAYLEAYVKGDFDSAIEQAKALHETAPTPLRGLYQIYIDRLNGLLKAPPADWDGIHQFDKK